jgi:hypothetical protein
MKNEVKKKMMIHLRNSPHQSHDERIFSANVNCFLRLVTPNLLIATPIIEQPQSISIAASRCPSAPESQRDQLQFDRLKPIAISAHL